MTPELIVAIIAFLAAGTALLKQITDMLRLRSQRQETKEIRDRDSSEIHDKLLTYGFQIQALKDDLALQKTVADDLASQMGILTNAITKLDVTVGNLAHVVEKLENK